MVGPVLLSLVLSSSNAQPAAPPVSHREYLETVIGALSQAHDAMAAIDVAAAENIFDRLVALKGAKVELDIASRRLASFAKDSGGNANRKGASDAMITAFGMLSKAADGLIAIYERLDAAESAADLKGMRSSVADVAVLTNQATKLLCDAAGLAVAAAVVRDPADPENQTALALSVADKNALVKMLREGFGGKLVKTIGDTGPANAAKLMLDTLGQDWRLAPPK